MKMFRRTKCKSLKERKDLCLVYLAELFDVLVFVLTFTFIQSDMKAYILFDYLED